MSADFSTETLQARRDWQKIFKVMKSKDLQPRLFYPAMLSFRIERHTKSFPDKEKIKEFMWFSFSSECLEGPVNKPRNA